MRPTRTCWTVAAVGGLLAVLAVLYARPVLLLGTAVLLGLLLGYQYRFLRALQTTRDALTVTQTLPVGRVRTGEETPVTLSATLDRPVPVRLEIDDGVPIVASRVDGDALRLVLEPGDTAASADGRLAWPVAGKAAFDEPAVTVRDGVGLFTETIETGSTPTVTVTPQAPGPVHIGQGGEGAVGAFGGHRSDQLGPGTDPAEIREYVPGDSVSDIDWKATARLRYPHVREYEVETDRQTVLLLDHRSTNATGPPGETTFDYLREVAMVLATSASEMNDPLGLGIVDDDGVTWEAPGTGADTFRSVQRLLADLTAPGEADRPERGSTGGSSTSRRSQVAAAGAAGSEDRGAAPAAGTGGRGRGPAPAGAGTARRKAGALSGDDSDFATQLRPFLQATDRYVAQLEGDTLFEAVRTQLNRVTGAVWAVVLTDDGDRAGLREAVKLARQRSTSVVVFIAPRVLHEPGGLADLEDAYRRYVDFEEFRRELDRLDGVEAYEVGPRDRLDAVLSAGREQRR